MDAPFLTPLARLAFRAAVHWLSELYIGSCIFDFPPPPPQRQTSTWFHKVLSFWFLLPMQVWGGHGPMGVKAPVCSLAGGGGECLLPAVPQCFLTLNMVGSRF